MIETCRPEEGIRDNESCWSPSWRSVDLPPVFQEDGGRCHRCTFLWILLIDPRLVINMSMMRMLAGRLALVKSRRTLCRTLAVSRSSLVSWQATPCRTSAWTLRPLGTSGDHRHVYNGFFTLADADGHLYGQRSNRSMIVFLTKPFVNGTIHVRNLTALIHPLVNLITAISSPCVSKLPVDYIWPVFVLTRPYLGGQLHSIVFGRRSESNIGEYVGILFLLENVCLIMARTF